MTVPLPGRNPFRWLPFAGLIGLRTRRGCSRTVAKLCCGLSLMTRIGSLSLPPLSLTAQCCRQDEALFKAASCCLAFPVALRPCIRQFRHSRGGVERTVTLRREYCHSIELFTTDALRSNVGSRSLQSRDVHSQIPNANAVKITRPWKYQPA